MLPTERRGVARRIFATFGLCALLIFPSGVFAHPMGNFTINHYSGIHFEHGWIEIRYFVDMAEIPTFQELQRSGLTGSLDDPKLNEYLSAQEQDLMTGLRTAINGSPVKLRII